MFIKGTFSFAFAACGCLLRIRKIWGRDVRVSLTSLFRGIYEPARELSYLLQTMLAGRAWRNFGMAISVYDGFARVPYKRRGLCCTWLSLRFWRRLAAVEESQTQLSKDTFFDVVNVKEKLYLAGRMTELRDIGLEILLHLFR